MSRSGVNAAATQQATGYKVATPATAASAPWEILRIEIIMRGGGFGAGRDAPTGLIDVWAVRHRRPSPRRLPRRPRTPRVDSSFAVNCKKSAIKLRACATRASSSDINPQNGMWKPRSSSSAMLSRIPLCACVQRHDEPTIGLQLIALREW